MFREMGSVSDVEAGQIRTASTPWLEQQLAAGDYVGWFALAHSVVVAGGGMHLRPLGPVPACCEGGRAGHIANLYTEPAHRGRGLARSLMQLMLAWGRDEKLNRITLSASEAGRPLYQSLGFTPTSEMQLLLL